MRRRRPEPEQHEPPIGRRHRPFGVISRVFMLIGIAAVLYLCFMYVLLPLLALLTPGS